MSDVPPAASGGHHEPTVPYGDDPPIHIPTVPYGDDPPVHVPTLPYGDEATAPHVGTVAYGEEPADADGFVFQRANATQGFKLPAALVDQGYRVLREFPARRRAEAFAALCSTSRNDRRGSVVVKVYARRAHEYEQQTVLTLGGVGSPRIVPIHAVDVDEDGYMYEVLGSLPGGSLRDRLIPGQAWAADDVRLLLRQLTDGLAAIHERPVDAIHRDIKPENIFLRDASGPVDSAIGDFGLLARTALAHRLRHERLGIRELGTMRYWSPNHPSRSADKKDDWWAVGLIMHEALFGRHWYDDAWTAERGGLDENRILSLLNRTRRPPVPQQHEDDRWNDLLAGLLEFDYSERWGERQVRAWLRGENPPSNRPKRGRAGTGGTTAAPDDTASIDFDKATYRDPVLLAAAMRSNWRAGRPFVAGIPTLQRIVSFVRRRGDEEMAVALERLRHDFEASSVPVPATQRLAAVTRVLDPTAAPRFEDTDLSAEFLAGQVEWAVSATASDERTVARTYLRSLFDAGVLPELGGLTHPDAAGLGSVSDDWIANYGIVTALLHDDGGLPPRVRGILAGSDGSLHAYALSLAQSDADGREDFRQPHLNALAYAEDDPVLNQAWFRRLVSAAWNGPPGDDDPRDGQVAAMSALIAGLVRDEARRAERDVVRDLSATEPEDFPPTAGGRAEDVAYRPAPENRVGRHPAIPRPAYPRYDPAAIFGQRRTLSSRAAAGQLFRILGVLGGGVLVLGLVRLFGLDGAQRIDVSAPQRLADAAAGQWFSGILQAWAGLHATWTSFPPLAAIDPLSAAGAWVPLAVGAVIVTIAVLASRSILPLPTRFKDEPAPRSYVATALLFGVVAAAVLIVLLPWSLALILPIVVALAIRPTYF